MYVKKKQLGGLGNPETKGLGLAALTKNILLLVVTTHKSAQ